MNSTDELLAEKKKIVGELLQAQDDLASAIGNFEAYFDADRRIREARRELRRLDREGA